MRFVAGTGPDGKDGTGRKHIVAVNGLASRPVTSFPSRLVSIVNVFLAGTGWDGKDWTGRKGIVNQP